MVDITIKKADSDLQIVYGEVYAPNVPDSQGEFMTTDTVRETAYRFMLSGRVTQVDTNHDNELNGSLIVESFIARAGDSEFIEGAWVVAIYIPDLELWGKVQRNELNGLSFESEQIVSSETVEIDMPQEIEGVTEEYNDHTHTFLVKFSDTGTYSGGITNIVGGHQHLIKRGTVTEISAGHTHRYSFMDDLVE